LKLPAWLKQGLPSSDCFLVSRGIKQVQAGSDRGTRLAAYLSMSKTPGMHQGATPLGRDSDHEAPLDTARFCGAALQPLSLPTNRHRIQPCRAGWAVQCHSRACKRCIGGLRPPDTLQRLQAGQPHVATTLGQIKNGPPSQQHGPSVLSLLLGPGRSWKGPAGNSHLPRLWGHQGSRRQGAACAPLCVLWLPLTAAADHQGRP